MLLKTNYIIEELLKNNITITGSLHIGAHECEEIPFYNNLGLKLKDIIWIEANPDKVEQAKKRSIPNVYEAVITNEDNKEIEFHVANNFQSSSVLDFGTHKEDNTDIKYVSSFIAKTINIKTFFKKHKILNPEKYNFWNFDIQGAELMALQGADELLNNVKAINLEVNTKEVYKGCPLIGDIDKYLSKFGFTRVLTIITPQGWGDALYIKEMKQIYIYNNSEFGNKVFTLIYGIYLYNLYKGECKINYVIDKTDKTDKTKYDNNNINNSELDIIFPDSKQKINFIKYYEISKYNKDEINKILKRNNKKYKLLREFPKYEDLDINTFFNDCYNLTYKMYSTFNNSDIDIFQNINKKLITDETILMYQNLDYILFDIRYKNLDCKLNKDNLCIENDLFLMYNPEYYNNILSKIKPNLFIIIITDSKEIVSNYVLSKYYKRNSYIFIDSNNLNSFYLYYNAKHIVMSNNTFSMAGSYFNNNKAYINYLFYRNKSSKYSLPEEQAISENWHIISDKKYILNYNLSLITELYNFNKLNKNIKYPIIKIKNFENLITNFNDNNILPLNYKNKTEISYIEYLYNNKVIVYLKNKYRNVIINPYSINKFYEEIYFDKVLNENNINSCILITKNVWSSYIKRLFDFSNIKIYNLYIYENDINEYDLHKPLTYYINKEIQKYDSLILFFIKDDYGIEFDFIYDYYMFKINEYLNTVKNLKLLIINYQPNLILPFTFNTLINICNHSESYKIIYINSITYIIFNNIKNYNIDVSQLKLSFKNLYENIKNLENEDILKEIAMSHNNKNSIGSSYFYKFNNFTNNKDGNYEYKIHLINYPITVDNHKFSNNLLLNIYKSYDDMKYKFNLFSFENITNKLLFSNYYYNKYNIWNKLIYNKHIERKNSIKSIKKYTIKNIIKSRKSRISKKSKIKFNNNKYSLRIITNTYEDYKNDLNVYIDIFTKLDFRVDVIYIPDDKRVFIKYEPNSYYDVNLFINVIMPKYNHYKNNFSKKLTKTNNDDGKTDYSFFTQIFPARKHMFVPNINSFDYYEQLKYIDIVLCYTKYAFNFMNFIKTENNKTYNYTIYYTGFTTLIPKELSTKDQIVTSPKNPNIFIHIAENQYNKNTSDLIQFWIKNNGFVNLDPFIELHAIVFGASYTNLLLKYKEIYKLSIDNTDGNSIIKIKNIYIYLKISNQKYRELLIKANIAICPSEKENYPHYINKARYYNTYILTMDSPPMNEFVQSTGLNIFNGLLLQNKTNYRIKTYSDTKFKFIQAYPYEQELKDKIIYCIKNKIKISKLNNTSRNDFEKDTKHFSMIINQIIIKLIHLRLQSDPEILNKYDKLFNTLNVSMKPIEYKFYPESQDDTHCKYISKRGLLKSCDIHSNYPVSDISELIGYDILKMYDGCSIYICTSAIPKFIEKMLMISKSYKYVLVSGDSISSCPDDIFTSNKDFIKFIESDNLIHWYAQNCTIKHPKITGIPLGIAYHHMIDEEDPKEAHRFKAPILQEKMVTDIRDKSKPFWERNIKCYISFIYNIERSNYGYDRIGAYYTIPNNVTYVESKENKDNKEASFTNASKCAFIISPLGFGLDAHRTWEGLMLGCIPIVRTSPLDHLYEDLPILIVKEWSDINEELLKNTINDFKEKHEKGKYNYDKLLLKYWVDKIHNHK